MVVLEGSQEAKKVDFFLRWKRKKFTSLIAGQHSAVTATTGNGALRTWRGLKKASPRRTSHAEESHRDDHLAVWTIYFKILAFNLNKTKAVWDSLFCLLSNEHQHDNYIKIDWFKKSTLFIKILTEQFQARSNAPRIKCHHFQSLEDGHTHLQRTLPLLVWNQFVKASFLQSLK